MTQSAPQLRNPGDPLWFREVLGQYPTGVCVVTAASGELLAGMAVGSFTSVSLNPPLVAFFPDRSSSSWPKIRSVGRFCVNILAADQEPVCRRFASKGDDKFAGLPYRMSARGSPIITGAVAWIDCDLHAVQEAGDHYIVQGLVRDLQIETAGLPLLFFQGGYGRFMPASLAAADPVGNLALQLRQVDVARPEMERIAAELQACCIATARVDREVIIAASAGATNRDLLPTLVGQRLPFMPPTGNVFVAWESDKQIDRYLGMARATESKHDARAALAAVRERGYSLGLRNEAQRRFATTLELLAQQGDITPSVDLREMVHELSYDPPELSAAVEKDVRLITAPVFAQDAAVAFALTLYGFRKPAAQTGIRAYIYRLLESAARVTALIGGGAPNL